MQNECMYYLQNPFFDDGKPANAEMQGNEDKFGKTGEIVTFVSPRPSEEDNEFPAEYYMENADEVIEELKDEDQLESNQSFKFPKS
jgi:hypothetical protein